MWPSELDFEPNYANFHGFNSRYLHIRVQAPHWRFRSRRGHATENGRTGAQPAAINSSIPPLPRTPRTHSQEVNGTDHSIRSQVLALVSLLILTIARHMNRASGRPRREGLGSLPGGNDG